MTKLSPGWVIKWVGKDIHAVPRRDLRTHKQSRHCWCRPRFQTEDESPTWVGDSDGVVVVHQALDNRE